MRSKGKLHRGKFGKCNLYDQCGLLIATTRNAPRKAKTNQANAQYFLECWNTFEEGGLVGEMGGALKAALEEIHEHNESPTATQLTRCLDTLKAVLARAAKEVGG